MIHEHREVAFGEALRDLGGGDGVGGGALRVLVVDPGLQHAAGLVDADLDVECLGGDVEVVSVGAGVVHHELEAELAGGRLQPLGHPRHGLDADRGLQGVQTAPAAELLYSGLETQTNKLSW